MPLPRKNNPGILWLLETLRKPWELNVFSNLEGKCQEEKRCAPPRRAQRSQCHTMKIIGKSLVFACPGRCNTVQSAESLCAAWEILWLLENLWKPMGKHSFRALSVQNKKQPPYGHLSWQRAITKYNIWEPMEDLWKSLGKHGFHALSVQN